MLDIKYILKLINYYTNDKKFADICSGYLQNQFNYFQLKQKIEKDYSDLQLVLITEICSFIHGLENYYLPIPNQNDQFYLYGMKTRLLEIKNSEMLQRLERYKPPFITSNRAKLISAYSITTSSDAVKMLGRIEFVNDKFPPIEWFI